MGGPGNNLGDAAFDPVWFDNLIWPRSLYTHAILGMYKLNKIDLLKDVFFWAYAPTSARRRSRGFLVDNHDMGARVLSAGRGCVGEKHRMLPAERAGRTAHGPSLILRYDSPNPQVHLHGLKSNACRTLLAMGVDAIA